MKILLIFFVGSLMAIQAFQLSPVQKFNSLDKLVKSRVQKKNTISSNSNILLSSSSLSSQLDLSVSPFATTINSIMQGTLVAALVTLLTLFFKPSIVLNSLSSASDPPLSISGPSLPFLDSSFLPSNVDIESMEKAQLFFDGHFNDNSKMLPEFSHDLPSSEFGALSPSFVVDDTSKTRVSSEYLSPTDGVAVSSRGRTVEEAVAAARLERQQAGKKYAESVLKSLDRGVGGVVSKASTSVSSTVGEKSRQVVGAGVGGDFPSDWFVSILKRKLTVTDLKEEQCRGKR